MLELNLIHTLALGGVVLGLGYAIRWAVPPLARYNLPAPVLGGLFVAVAVLVARQWNVELFTFHDPYLELKEKNFKFEKTLLEPLMIAFFTTIGFGASLGLLKKGGPQVLWFLGLCTVAAILQNLFGALTAWLTGQPPLFGVLCGSVTLTGGPATGLAFADQFEAAGVKGAEAIAIAAAMIGIVTGGIIGAPIGTLLIERLERANKNIPPAPGDLPRTAQEVVEAQLPSEAVTLPVGEDVESYGLLKSIAIILVAMWAGSWVSGWITAQGMKLPPYIGAMLVASAIRNLDDATGWIKLSQNVIDDIGNVALAFFLVLSLMMLELWTLAAVAFPLFAVLVVQAILIAVLCFWPVFPFMGKDHDAAVLSGGFCGFMMGTTANAMANMEALVKRYGAAPRAYLIVPMVGAFFIDFTNALLIQGCLNLFS